MRARSRDSLILSFRAAVLLHLLTGWNYERVWRVLSELSFEASLDDVRRWLCYGDKPNFTPTALEKSLFYHRAYELALKTRRRTS